MKLLRILFAFLLLTTGVSMAQEFQWSWEEDGKKKGEADAVATAEKAADVEEDFEWSFNEGEEKQVAPPKDTGQVGADAYNDLLKENLTLRKQLAEAEKDEEQIRKEKEALAKEVRDYEARIGQFTTRIKQLNDQKEAAETRVTAVDPDKVMELESQLAAAEGEKARLAKQLASLKEKQALDVPEEPAPLPMPSVAVQPDSDLYRQLEQENAKLKQKLAAVESEKKTVAQSSEMASQEREALEAELEKTRLAEQQTKEALEKVMKELPSLEKELTQLREGVENKDADIAARERALLSMKAELERREQRLVKAEKITELLERTRAELQWRNDLEKRDMHYNMASVHASEGRYEEAEKEYLRALRIDPNDADTHYNLGILYEQSFKNIRRARMHYRKYLKLKPNAEDGDQVRIWLMESESAN